MQVQIFKNRNFVWYWLSSVLAGLGDVVLSMALSWMVVELTGSGAMLGAMLAAIGVPRVVLTLFAGVLVDRMNPVKVLIGGEWVRVWTVGGLMLMSFGGRPPVWSLFAAAFLFGCLEAFFWPAASAVQQRMLQPEQYTQGSGLLMIAMKTTAVVGPVFSGMLMDVGDARTVVIGTFVAFLSSLVMLNLIRVPNAVTVGEHFVSKKQSFREDLLTGFRFIWRTPVILATSISAFLANFSSAGALVGLVFLAKAFGAGAGGYGWLLTGIGIGGTVGAVLFSVVTIKRPTPRMTQVTCFLEGLVFLLVAWSGNFMLTVCLIGLIGLTDSAVNVIAPSVNRILIPQALFGRVISTTILLMSSSVPVAQAISGGLIQSFGVHRVMAFGGGLEAVTAVVCFFIPAISLYRQSCNSSATSNC
nr:MFS transporter [Tumebacillus amylolyticus]